MTLTCRDLDLSALGSDLVDEPCCLQHQEAGLLDFHSRFGDPGPDNSLIRDRPAKSVTRLGTSNHQVQSALRHADAAHGVVNSAWTQARLCDGRTRLLRTQAYLLPVLERYRTEFHSGRVGRGIRISVNCARFRLQRLATGTKIIDCCLWGSALGIRLPHDYQNFAPWVCCTGRPPFSTVHDVFVAVPNNRRHDVRASEDATSGSVMEKP